MIVTTSLRPTEKMISKAKAVANDLDLPLIKRNKEPISTLHQQYHCDIIVAGSNRLSIYKLENEQPLFFHPNSAMFRVKRILKGEGDPYLQATKLTSGMSVLDCTLGLASDSILSSVVVGNNGKVVGIEGNRYLAYLVREGLVTWDSGIREMNEAMQRIEVVSANHLDYLRHEKTNAYDVVYFDPMFEVKIESEGINAIRKLAVYQDLDEETIEEAKRVARSRIVLKDHWQSSRFQRFNFQVYKRTTSQFHYASIEI
ncbi:protein-L-IsoD(D-D) O-methyltransferase [Anaerobacillus alkaliphilus]|uniref:Protein-L-IsoD(D-D) O-methyltransferase n=1 Tax=Anaerobacillus alkaliphilus TaxID=1548597 RepID=A0A4Q0VP78_9BACI|nr:class I SAM-dependent methyltransferase [Anaerobacillus alkaliphilus]RXI97929.1 protein-L-IsoD(D-D) O-methyltransferase [Anaerobacillus alkaliphilus]